MCGLVKFYGVLIRLDEVLYEDFSFMEVDLVVFNEQFERIRMI